MNAIGTESAISLIMSNLITDGGSFDGYTTEEEHYASLPDDSCFDGYDRGDLDYQEEEELDHTVGGIAVWQGVQAMTRALYDLACACDPLPF